MELVIEFKLPALGENIEQGDLVRLMIAPGATVNEGQAVMELETDKAVVEVPSSVSGTVKEILVKEGEKIKVGQVVFTADSNGAAAPVPEKPLPAEPTAAIEKPLAPVSKLPESQPAPQRMRSTDAAPASEFRLQELG
ncbi:MAG: biotin/lipoyl-containing protein, partial [Candidatus Sulfotelmatobacter sp.]